MTTQEQENFYRHSTVIVDETKDCFIQLLDFYLTNQGTMFQRFIEINGHYIYHLCYNRYPCCQCPPGTRAETRGNRVLHPPQLDTLFDKTGNKLPVHNSRSKSAPNCCCPVNPNLQLKDIDFTLARLLLVNFTTLVPQGSLERNALDDLVNSRNQSFAHAKEGKISDSEYQKSMAELEKSLLVLAKIYGKETETKLRLSYIAKQPLNSTICLQLQSTLLQQQNTLLQHQNTLLQQCQIEETMKQLLAEKKFPDCLTKDLCDVTVTEGCDAHFEIRTKEYGLFSLWLRDDVEIEISEKFMPKESGKVHSLGIRNSCLADKGLYTVRIKNIERQAHLDVEEYFTKNLQCLECIEGETAEFICEVKEDSLPARWNKNGIHLETDGKYEILQAGKIHRLSIKNCVQHDTGNYTVSINNRVRATSLAVIEYFTKSLERNVDCIEGDMVDLCCEVMDADATAEWVKEGVVLQTCNKYEIKVCGKIHTLSIVQAELQDAGDYTVKINSRQRSTTIHIKEYFTKSLDTRICIEGENVQIECEVLEDNQTALWFKDETEVITSNRFQVERHGKRHRLVVNNTILDDQGEYSAKIKNCVRKSKLIVQEYFTKNLERNVDCIEGDMVDLCCEVMHADATAEWVKEGVVLQTCNKYEIKVCGKIHTLSIVQAELQDAGDYTVKINSRQRSTTIHIKEYFTKSLDTKTCIEGENVQIECEVLEDNQTALWFKDETEVITSNRFQVERHGKRHRLVVNNTILDDQGEYSAKIKNCVRKSKLIVQAIPAAIRELSDEEKDLYLEIIKSGTETRLYIRIVIIGENGVGKTCLLRRLLGKSIEDVESTDGIDVHMCKIRQNDGQWVVDEVTNLKRDMMTRIKMASKENAKTRDALLIIAEALSVNAITHETANNEQDDYSQSNNTGSPEDNYIQPGTRKKNRPTKVKRKSTDNKMDNNKASTSGTYDSIHGNSETLTLLEDEFKRTLSESIQIQKLEKKIEPRLGKILNETILSELSQFINDIEKYQISDEVLVDCRIWDFAGQKHYYPTHSTFLNPNAVHLLVCNIMKDITQINTETGYDKIGEYIDFWFDSIHSCGAIEDVLKSTGDYLNPPVIVVCTGTDKCKDQLHERKEKFRKQLLSMMHKEDKQKHLRRICHLSNTEPSNKDFDDLRKAIFEFGKNIESYGKKLPLRWIRLEQTLDIVRGADVNLLSWPDITDLASKCSIEDELEVSLFLKYHHKVGSIIYFESLKEHIILNPKWLADAFRCFVSDKYDDDLKLTPEWKTLEDTGELKPSLIVKLFHKEQEREFYKHEGLLLKLMEMFGVIVKLESCIEEKQNLWTYYMPCMISEKTSIEEIFNVFGVKRNYCTQTPWLCIQFNFMPIDFFNHIFCHYIRKYTVCSEASSGRMALYHGMGVFYLDNTKSRKLILCFSKNTIAMQIWQWRKLEQGVCKSMLEELRSVIHTVKDKYEPRRISYYEKAKCANGNIHITHGRCNYKDLKGLGVMEFFCEEHNEMHDTKDFFQTWFEDYLEENIQYPRNENCESTSKEVKVDKEDTTDAVTATPATPSQPISTIQKFPYDVEYIYTRVQDENRIKHGSQDARFKQKCHVCEKEPSVYWCYGCRRSMCLDCYNLHRKSTDTKYHIVQHVQDIYALDYNFHVNVKWITDIKVLQDMLVIAGNQLVTCDITGQQHTIPLPGGPWHIAVVDNNTVAVTLSSTTMVVIVDVRQRQVLQRFDVELGCYGIMYRDNQLFVACITTIKVMNILGEVTRTIHLDVIPQYICGGEAGRVYYTDHDKLYCIDTVGNTLFSFTYPNMSVPRGITIDDKGYILVICYKSNNVLKISPDGKHSQVIITQVPPLSGVSPCICYNFLSKSVVICRGDNVSVYKKV